jgi:hypothetical protein
MHTTQAGSPFAASTAAQPGPRTRGLRLAAGLALSALCSLAGTAQAGDVVARAGQNPNFIQDSNPGATAQAVWPVDSPTPSASAHTTRTRTSVFADGNGASASFHHNAASSHVTLYELWDLATQQPVAPALAADTLLDFNFHLTGATTVEAVSLSNLTFQYWALLTSNSESFELASSVNVVFGPGPGGSQYLVSGDASLYGAFDQRFSLRHSGDDGRLLMLSAGLAGNQSLMQGSLSLESISLVDGWNGGALGVRLLETGEILPVVGSIPEPGTWALWLAGLALMGRALAQRTRRDAQAALPQLPLA